MIDFNTFTKLPKNVGNFGKLIIAKCFKKLPKVQQIAQSGNTANHVPTGNHKAQTFYKFRLKREGSIWIKIWGWRVYYNLRTEIISSILQL